MITIIDYKAGNLTSVKLAFDSLGIKSKITKDPIEVLKAKKAIFPGDGAAKSAMEHLQELNLLMPVKQVIENGIPFLGICLGTQIILDKSEENNNIDCLGVIPGVATKFMPSDMKMKIPHMGWNSVNFMVEHPVFDEIENKSEFYFIHSYYPAPKFSQNTLAQTMYGGVEFASIIGKKNLVATQFHPERSGRIGLKMLKNFAMWDGTC